MPLRQAGLVTSVRGAHGGFELAKPADQITVLDLVEAVEGPLEANICESAHANQGGCAKHTACAAASVWNRATIALRHEFESTNIQELATIQRKLDDTDK